MKRQVPVHLVDDDPETAARSLEPTRTVVETPVPDAPYDLGSRKLVWPMVVEDHETCAAVMEAALRGVAVVLRLGDELGAADAACLRDERDRACRPHAERRNAPRVVLTAEQHHLLDALSAGATVAEAAAQLHLSPRTASRRLADARRALDVASNAEAIAAVRRGPRPR